MPPFIRILLCLLCLSSGLFAQKEVSPTGKMTSLARIWGFLKYYHPAIAAGQLDWDQELITRIRELQEPFTPIQLDRYYQNWINSLSDVKPCKKCMPVPKADSLSRNLDWAWTNSWSDSLQMQLNHIRNNRYQGKLYYAGQFPGVGNTSFKNENAFMSQVFPPEEMRLLALFRYWNVIEYFYPYKYMTDIPWSRTLEDMIPSFRAAGDSIAYYAALLQLASRLNDGHAVVSAPFWKDYSTDPVSGEYHPPFRCKIIGKGALVTQLLDEEKCRQMDIRIGDWVLEWNGKRIAELVEEKKQFFSASNPGALKLKMEYVFLNRNENQAEARMERQGQAFSKTIPLFKRKELKPPEQPKPDSWKQINDSVAYINPGVLRTDMVDLIFEHLLDKKFWIMDLRSYPEFMISKLMVWMNTEKKPFYQASRPVLSYPGVFNYSGPIYTEKKGNKVFQGQVLLLVNENTMSRAEFTCMALQTAARTITIGRPTAGADGNVSVVVLPGGYNAWFTGIGIYYPDGRPTQRSGVDIQITVRPSPEGLIAGKDEILERALDWTRNGK